ncbi:hypothetical protein ACFOY4_16610 [Actinomadura syzygii]|uniref:Uncharacterized protein n=1 Tax=Actinomadura syzygii TaxID=1427538 RepID=A0A5D0TZN4_9ACTN|nr:hypothetical protein [Actinomadura syzygii]TYC10835.1 hypothetical protein FXF65_28025 [Actinomadura syzygii]
MRIPAGLRGRPAPAPPDLDRLFGVPSAAAALAAATGLVPSGEAGVCHRLVEGGPFGAFGRAQRDVAGLLAGDGARATGLTADPHGWGWVRVTRPPDELDRLVADLHVVCATLTAAGYGGYLLCSAVAFRRDGDRQRCVLVHTPGRGTFYPFAPRPSGEPGTVRRNNTVETRVREALEGELPIEPDRARWFPVWDAPGL